jgi:DNA-binding MurR/RpiR family transcriptional regulator
MTEPRGHLTADEVADRCAVGTATVYRTLGGYRD